MILKIYYLSKLYLLEQIRRQVHLVTLFLAVILLMLPAYVNSFSLGLSAFERVAKDFGLTLISFYAVAMAIFLGVTAVSSDLERRTLYPLLARPIPRWAYLIGWPRAGWRWGAWTRGPPTRSPSGSPRR